MSLNPGLQRLARAEVQPQVRAGQEGQPGDELREGAEEDVRPARLRIRSRWADRRVKKSPNCPGRMVYVVVTSPPATEETEAISCEIESRQGIGW
jgi:hypothetical protein